MNEPGPLEKAVREAVADDDLLAKSWIAREIYADDEHFQAMEKFAKDLVSHDQRPA